MLRSKITSSVPTVHGALRMTNISEIEYQEATRIINILMSNGVIPKDAAIEANMKVWRSAMEIIALMKSRGAK